MRNIAGELSLRAPNWTRRLRLRAGWGYCADRVVVARVSESDSVEGWQFCRVIWRPRHQRCLLAHNGANRRYTGFHGEHSPQRQPGSATGTRPPRRRLGRGRRGKLSGQRSAGTHAAPQARFAQARFQAAGPGDWARPSMSRPFFFNLMQVRMPVGAITSIADRVTGVLLALGVSLSIYLLGCR